MRYLTVVRHCEAVAGSDDEHRTLSARGRAQANELRAFATDPTALGRFGPTTALVSSAARTRETHALGFAGTPFVNALETSSLIYNGHREVSGEDVLAQLAEIDPVRTSLLVVAHYPTVWELVTSLAATTPTSLASGEYPLGGAYVLAIPTDRTVGLATYDLVAEFVPGA